jgi:hypothetical protein
VTLNALAVRINHLRSYKARKVLLVTLGYRKIGEGCFRTVWSKPRGSYVVKLIKSKLDRGFVADERADVRRNRIPVVPLVATFPGVVDIQPRVRVCGRSGCWMDRYADGHPGNHTHQRGHKLLFDY